MDFSLLSRLLILRLASFDDLMASCTVDFALVVMLVASVAFSCASLAVLRMLRTSSTISAIFASIGARSCLRVFMIGSLLGGSDSGGEASWSAMVTSVNFCQRYLRSLGWIGVKRHVFT